MLTALAAAAVDPPSSPLEIWLRFAGTIAAIASAAFATWYATNRSTIRLEKTAEQTKAAAETAAAIAEPIGPDRTTFAASVLASLSELKEGQREQGERLARHLEDHAGSDLRRPHRV